MELKEYQRRSLKQVENYLINLKDCYGRVKQNKELADFDFAEMAWKKTASVKRYNSKQNGLGHSIPNFCLKIPTGGGKTLLATKAIDLVNTHYRQQKTGLVLWVVPSTQIYNQTLRTLKNKDHPYRQQLDLSSAGRTKVIEKGEKFTPLDLSENLIVLLLMLPSAARQNKETLKLFRDSGGFQEFFPGEDQPDKHEELLANIPNLDFFGQEKGFWKRQIKTSMGNILRIVKPIIILDESHKAYSENAQQTLCGFNPCIIIELTATNKDDSNVLVDVKGRELDQEQMIKLDLHIHNRANLDWKDLLLESIKKREDLELLSQKMESNVGNYVRPIMLIQVERTGNDQRDDRKVIHSEQVKEYLINTYGIPSDQVAIKTSTKDDLKEIDDTGGLLERSCQVRYIITKQALQEGWDCSFAYILTILTNAGSETALTQLVGRILRQPYARKFSDEYQPLNESYVYTFQQQPSALLEQIRKGFELEGLGDLGLRISRDDINQIKPEIVPKIRERFRDSASTIALPYFAKKDGKNWRPISYEMDILSQINWGQVDLNPLFNLQLNARERLSQDLRVNLNRDLIGNEELISWSGEASIIKERLKYDPALIARHLAEDILPNPWVAYDISKSIFEVLKSKFDESRILDEFIYIIQATKNHLSNEKNRLAEDIFKKSLKEETINFVVISNGLFDITKPIKTKDTKRLTNNKALPIQASLFDAVIEDDFNQDEKEFVWFLEEQQSLFWWYRNVPRQGYALQGWQKGRIYPDFIFTVEEDSQPDGKVYVVEYKGVHLKGNEDTSYKQAVFEICNDAAMKEIDFKTLDKAFKNRAIQFEVAYGDEWQQKFRQLLT
ncbi:MAG: restriction endonuclease subunit R [Alphaproteobacteria bacterium]|nr:MAG: restriction endonuclease subunit R [Alphaproteobacteria bacterium]